MLKIVGSWGSALNSAGSSQRSLRLISWWRGGLIAAPSHYPHLHCRPSVSIFGPHSAASPTVFISPNAYGLDKTLYVVSRSVTGYADRGWAWQSSTKCRLAKQLPQPLLKWLSSDHKRLSRWNPDCIDHKRRFLVFSPLHGYTLTGVLSDKIKKKAISL